MRTRLSKLRRAGKQRANLEVRNVVPAYLEEFGFHSVGLGRRGKRKGLMVF
jgi:hypothetical protein